jgi:integrase
MRVGEAIRLDRQDLDLEAGVLVVRQTKFNKTRELPLHPTTVAALGAYLGQRDRQEPAPGCSAVFISPAGTRLLYCNIQWTFQRLARRAGLRPRSGSCRPRIHDYADLPVMPTSAGNALREGVNVLATSA